MRYLSIWGAVSGLLAVAVALSVAELASSGLGTTSLVVAIGDVVIDHSPRRVTRTAIDLFGTHDKTALIVAILATTFLLGSAAGMLARRWFTAGAGVFVLLGAAGAGAGVADPLGSGIDATVAAVCAAGAGILTLRLLTGPGSTERGPGSAAPGQPQVSRRRFFRVAGGAAGISGASLIGGRWVIGPAVDVEAERASVTLPAVTEGEGDPGDIAAAALDVVGISPLVTPNSDFYRIDTRLAVPRIELADWRLRVTGLVDNPFEVTHEELLGMGVVEEIVTLSCVSNMVGGDLIGNARWLGVPLKKLLDRAGVRPEGTQVVARSVDGFTTAFRTDVALDGRPAMVAVGMNGEVLPASHGFPARMIVPGLYGYVSATKWLVEIELTRLEDFGAYWITRGWAKEGPIKTQSRFDIPKQNASVPAGKIQFGGMAWGGIRSVSKVEVRIVEVEEAREAFGPQWLWLLSPDYGEWREARMSDVISQSSWRQWALEWDAKPGVYRVEVRATDGLGETQTHERQPPEPDGATGYDGFNLTVTEA